VNYVLPRSANNTRI